MQFRMKELNKRPVFQRMKWGKRKLDAWNHERVYFNRTVQGNGCATSLVDFLLPTRITLLEFAIANNFIDSLTDRERLFLDAPADDYKLKEIPFDRTCLQSLLTKAVAYL